MSANGLADEEKVMVLQFCGDAFGLMTLNNKEVGIKAGHVRALICGPGVFKIIKTATALEVSVGLDG